jgi:hypothetical protein
MNWTYSLRIVEWLEILKEQGYGQVSWKKSLIAVINIDW